MAGNPPVPSSAPQPPGQPPKRKVKTFTCPSCGGTVEIRTFGLAISVVCAHCKSVIDATNENFELLSKYRSKTGNFTPKLEIGSRCNLRDKRWEMIGFQVRKDVASGVNWDEYLLWNPYYGYRWLTCYRGHWNFVTTIKEKPNLDSRYAAAGSYNSITLGDKAYKIFYSGKAETLFVLGEFYWQVAVGGQVEMCDFIDPPVMVSSESDSGEVVWSRSEYLQPQEVEKAFGLKKQLDKPEGIGPNQPSPSLKSWNRIALFWAIFLFVLTVAEFNHVMSAKNTTVFQQGFNAITNTKSTDTITTPVFELDKAKSNLTIDFSSSTDNNWLWIGGELVNDTTGETYPFEKTMSYYHGYEDGESWSEGSNNVHLNLSQIPGGKYYLNMDSESGDFRQTGDMLPFTVMIRRDVPTYANYFLCLVLVSLLPGLSWYSMRNIEVARWSDSDYTPYQSGSSQVSGLDLDDD